jgi:hypothetical protein
MIASVTAVVVSSAMRQGRGSSQMKISAIDENAGSARARQTSSVWMTRSRARSTTGCGGVSASARMNEA